MPEYPESGDYVVGRYEVSARVDEFSERSVTPGYLRSYEPGPTKRTPVVIVSSLKAAHAFLTASPADARGIASALIVAADQADKDANRVAANNTPAWITALDPRTSELAALQDELATVTAEIERLHAELRRLDVALDTVTTERDNALAMAKTATTQRVDAELQSLKMVAELDTVTTERDNALAELANCPDEGYADAHRAPVDLNAMRAKLAGPGAKANYPGFGAGGADYNPGKD